MSNYTLSHTAKTTLISMDFKRRGFKETMQYEFAGLLTQSQVKSVYDELSEQQRKTISTNKNSFKQFIRALKMKNPVVRGIKKDSIATLVSEEKILIASRLSKHLGISSNDSAKMMMGHGSINAKKYKTQIANKESGTLLKDENIIYWENQGFVYAISTKPLYKTDSNVDMYIYVILLVS